MASIKFEDEINTGKFNRNRTGFLPAQTRVLKDRANAGEFDTDPDLVDDNDMQAEFLESQSDEGEVEERWI